MAFKKTTLSGKAATSSRGGTNKLKEFMDGLKSKREQRKIDARKKISNNNAANEAKIIAVLDGIDFSKSKLDPAILDYKTISSQLYGDLEYTRNEVRNSIISNTTYADLKLKDFDTRLYEIAVEYLNAISNGHKNAAFAARSALYIAVVQIRNQLPFVPQNWRQNYLNSCTEYLDKWIQLIEECISLDASNNSLEKSEIQLQSKLAEADMKLKTDLEQLKDDPVLLKKIIAMRNMPVGQTLGDPMLKKLFNKLMDGEINTKLIKFDIEMNKMQRRRQLMYAAQVEMLRRNVENQPIPNDPLSFQKFQGAVDGMFQDMIKVDNEYRAFMELMYDIEGRLDQLAQSQASKMEHKMVQDQISKLIEAANAINENELETMTVRELREKLGIKEKETHTEENIEENTDTDTDTDDEENLNEE